MPRVSKKFSLAPLNWGKESIGQRVARSRKEIGCTPVEFAAQPGIVQSLVTDYATHLLGLTAEGAARFATALHVTLDVFKAGNSCFAHAQPQSASHRPEVSHDLRRLHPRRGHLKSGQWGTPQNRAMEGGHGGTLSCMITGI